MAGSLSLELHFSLSQMYSSTRTAETADGYRQFRETVQNSFQADYSFDMSFLAKMDSTAQKMGSIGTDVLGQFVDAANGLLSGNEGDLKKFMEATDKLFNELSGAIGGGNALDGAKELLKGSVSDFIGMVNDASRSMGLPEGVASPVAGALPPPPPPPGEGGNAGAIDFSKLYDEVTQNFDEAYANLLQGMTADAGRMINDNIKSFMEELKKIQEKQKDNPNGRQLPEKSAA